MLHRSLLGLLGLAIAAPASAQTLISEIRTAQPGVSARAASSTLKVPMPQVLLAASQR